MDSAADEPRGPLLLYGGFCGAVALFYPSGRKGQVRIKPVAALAAAANVVAAAAGRRGLRRRGARHRENEHVSAYRHKVKQVVKRQ